MGIYSKAISQAEHNKFSWGRISFFTTITFQIFLLQFSPMDENKLLVVLG